MHPYAPDSMTTVAWVAAAPVCSLIIGRLPIRRMEAWIQVVLLVCGVERVTLGCGPGFRMVAIIVALFTSMKVVVRVECPNAQLDTGRWLAWALGWPGMRPELFARRLKPDRAGGARLAARGALCMTTGALLAVAARLAHDHTSSLVLTTALLLPAISLVLHFGLFDVVAGGWRAIGVPTETLFPAPLRSRTLSEFWGKRWNLPFTEMIQRTIYRPLTVRMSRDGAALSAFVASGALHELAISVPVRAYYGLPSIYFVLHGVLLLTERRNPRLKARLEGSALGHVWTIFWLVLPLPILFHPPFLRGVVWPLIGIQG